MALSRLPLSCIGRFHFNGIKSSETFKFDLFMKCNVKNIFFIKNHTEKVAGRLAPDRFSFLKKALYEVNASG